MPTTKLPSTGTRLVDAAMKRDAMIALYEMQSLKENPDKDGHVYGPSKAVSKKYGLAADGRYLRDAMKQMPAGMAGKEIDRAANLICFPKGGGGRRRNYTDAEFELCVVGSLKPGGKITDCEKYAIGRANFCRARGGLKAWRLAHPDSNDHAYFLGLKKPGAPTKLLPDEEHFLAERLNLQAAHGFGMDERQAKRYTSGLMAANGQSGGGSRSHIDGIRRRAKLSEEAGGGGLVKRKASDMSYNRAQALTLEKHHVMFNKYEAGIKKLADEGRFCDRRAPLPKYIINSDEMSPGSGKYGKVICRCSGTRSGRWPPRRWWCRAAPRSCLPSRRRAGAPTIATRRTTRGTSMMCRE